MTNRHIKILYIIIHCISCSIVSDSMDPMDCMPPGFSVHVILQARILDWLDNSPLHSILKYRFKTQWDITSPSLGCFYENKFYIPCGSVGKISPCQTGDLGSIPGLGRSPGEGRGCPFQYSGLENSIECIVHGVTKSRAWLNNFRFTSLHKTKSNWKQCVMDHLEVVELSHTIDTAVKWCSHYEKHN